MALFEHHNWIGGRWLAAEGERCFERLEACDSGSAETREHRWPESSANDVRAAIEAAASAAQRWTNATREARWRRLEELAQSLVRALDAFELGGELGLSSADYGAHLAEHELRLFEALEMHREGPASVGVFAFGAHWSDGPAGLLARLAPRLLAGECGVLVADARAPQAAQALAAALESSTLGDGVLNVLHGETREAREALLATPGLAGVRWKGTQAELEALLARLGPRAAPTWELWLCANRSLIVCERDNPSEAAERVAEQAFSRGATLSGQHPGHVARVLCHQRIYSRLCEELRSRLAADAEAQTPCRALDDDLERHVLSLWSLGVDEGATPVFGAPPTARERGRAEGVGGIVFVNVDPAGALARSSRPAPVLSLVRVASDEEGRELRTRVDLGPRWR
ncbi:MAG: aldehyde dehydrogenase family protein [Planctomycetes bacterium]|nr:aldehyde dehydrogenase family protein [Planctomycetota bacterium]